jgi:carboxyl-terminal processing protease
MDFCRNKIYVGLIFISLAAVSAMGFFYGAHYQLNKDQTANIINKNPSGAAQVDFAPFWNVWNIINEKYVSTNGTSTDKVSDQARIYGAIQGQVAALSDPYTVFFPPIEAKNFNEEISGNFEGVGMEVGIKDDVLTVISPLKGTPAALAGIKTGDKVLKINNTLTTNLTVDEAVGMIRGKKGTAVKLLLSRSGVKNPFEVSVIRDTINLPTIDTDTRGDVFIIRLYNFSAISPNLFRDALRQFIESGKSKLILDLRGNPGGYLEAAIDMASWFLPTGKTVVKEDFRNASDAQIYRSKGYNVFTDKLKMVVLIDGGSASASEILAGALHDNGVATLVGEQSFGKGSVQELVDITPDTSLKVTIARWLTPNGISISHQGLTPDVVVKLDPDKLAKGVDTQVNKAIEILDK